jgi:hypothetical protein
MPTWNRLRVPTLSIDHANRDRKANACSRSSSAMVVSHVPLLQDEIHYQTLPVPRCEHDRSYNASLIRQFQSAGPHIPLELLPVGPGIPVEQALMQVTETPLQPQCKL